MGTISEKLTYLNETKQELKQAINNLGGEIDNNTTFREYVEELQDIYDNLPKTSYGEGTNISLANTLKGKLDFDNLLYGDTSQDGTPTPETPVDIKVVTGTQEIKVVGKNLFNGNLEQGTISTSDGQPSSNNTRIRSVDFINVKSTQQYTLSGSYSETVQTVIYQYNDDETFNSVITGTWKSLPHTFTPSTNKIKIVLRYNDNSAITPSNVTNTQIELGSTATTYSPYSSTSYTISLGNIELAKIGDYKDYIYKSGDKWYKHQVIGKKTYVGTETFNETVESGKHRFSDNTIASEIETSMLPYCNYFTTSLGTSNIWTDGYVSLPTSGNVSFYIASITTSSVWRNWLSEHNTILYYGLKSTSQQDIEITNSTLIEELNSLYNAYSKYGTTNIQVEGTLAGGLKVRALKGV